MTDDEKSVQMTEYLDSLYEKTNIQLMSEIRRMLMLIGTLKNVVTQMKIDAEKLHEAGCNKAG